ncbi:MAG TPA: DUF4079 domain-containing protein [Desulfobulbus sp.]|nr:DUF4079 domain-containing protein [Desulfobulbus sp.]
MMLTFILTIHPVLQGTTTLVAMYVLLLGAARFRRLHLHQKTMFQWRRHVIFGTIALLLWAMGLVLGMLMVRVFWHGFLVTGTHGGRGVLLLPLILFGLFSGRYMHIHKQQRILLPLLHGTANLLLIVMALLQAFTGLQVYKEFVLG